MEITEEEVARLRELLSEFKDLDPIPEYMPTIFEISGYPHYEDVISNVLQFFLKSDYNHGFSSIFVESLLNALNGLDRQELPSDFSVLDVEREVSTYKNNRIDLVIKTETHCIAIENKINHHLHDNDLQDYQDYINKENSESENVFLVLSQTQKEKPNDWESNDFKFITYDEFFDQLEERLGKVISEADAKIVIYLSDLIKTLRNMNKRTQLTMEFLDFLSENRKDIESFYENVFKNFKNEVESKAKEIDRVVSLKDTGFKSSQYNPSGELKYVKYYEKSIPWKGSEFTLKIKFRLTPKQYSLEVWTPKSSDEQNLKEYVDDKYEEKTEDWEYRPKDRTGAILIKKFKYGEESNKIVDELNKLIRKLA